MSAEADFVAAAAERGVQISDLVSDGKIHRVDVAGKRPGNRDGAYLLHVDGMAAGGFQNHGDGQGWQNWCSRRDDDLSPVERAAYRARIREMQRLRNAEEQRQHAEVAAKAERLWRMMSPIVGSAHPYLVRKGVQAHGARLAHNCLVIAARDSNGKLWTLHYIPAAAGAKKIFLRGGRKRGLFCVLGEPGPIIIICEGFATAASIREATGYPVVVAFDCGNLEPVARALRVKYPTARICVVADDDWKKEGNPGMTHATTAAKAINATLVKLDFGPSRSSDATDANDLARSLGSDELQRQIAETLATTSVETTEPDAVLPAARPARRYAMTETGGAELLADRLRGDWYYITERDKWIHWDGQRWTFDVGGVRLMERSKLVADEFLAEAKWALDNDDARGKAWAQFAATAQRRNTRANFIALAKSEPGIAVPFSQFDTDRYLLNVANGTIDLRTGKLRPHRREDKITRALPWNYDERATCPRWERFLVEVLPDTETIAFAQKLVGYCLTGVTTEHIVIFCFGMGANGKTVFVNVLLLLLGEYATQAPTSMLIASQGERHPTELVTLHGRRLVVCSEVPGGKPWNEELLKSISGGDVISARGMREDFWTFTPTHKMIISGNHKPVVRGQDEGIWRRWRLLPFERTIPEADRDPKLSEKLAAEMLGILAWAVRGCLTWQHEGLKPSAKVVAATADYRTESDRIAPFVAECCIVNESAVSPRADLYRAYRAWSEAQGERRPLSEKDFAEYVRGKGVAECWTRADGKKCRGWKGIELATGGNTRRNDFPINSSVATTCEVNPQNRRDVLPGVAEVGEDWS